MTLVETKIIENFFNDDELRFLETTPDRHPNLQWGHEKDEPQISPDFVTRRVFGLLDSRYEEENRLLREKLDKHFDPRLKVGAFHILEASYPYKAHTDGIKGQYLIDDDHYGAWTLVIPLETFDSHTIVFNQHSYDSKMIHPFMEKNPKLNAIDEDTYQKYLSHEWREAMDYFSIETIFPWKKGSCFAMSRYKWHTSDNFYPKGIIKRALIAWTVLPITA